jgi:radical SAM superfamily enzyme YgiQ (UPF0313 family)
MKEFCDLYKQEGLANEFKWICSTRADVITKDWARMAAEAGCAVVNLGIESGDDYIRNQVYKKDISRDDIRKATSNLRDHGIAFGFLMMIGCPQDTRKTIKAGMDLIREMSPVRAYFCLFQALPKTELAKQVDDSLWINDREFAQQGNILRLRTFHLTAGEILRITWRIRFSEIFRFFKMGWKMKKMAFILDIIKFILSIDHCRHVPLTSPHIKPEIEQKTIYKYITEMRKTRAGN